MSTTVYNLEDLLNVLDAGGALTYVDCGTYAKIYFDKDISIGGDDKRPKSSDIRFMDKDYQSEWNVEVETGMCGTLVDVYFTKDDEDEDDYAPEYEAEPPF